VGDLKFGCDEARLLFGHLKTSGASGATGQKSGHDEGVAPEDAKVRVERFKDQSGKGDQKEWFYGYFWCNAGNFD
jgi:hypothetical protein